MLLGRAALYFDEVARRGALRRAADVLHIAPSAVDRQIIQLEEELGTKLFERTPNGMRMTAAGEVLVDGVRRWRRDLARIRSDIDNLVCCAAIWMRKRDNQDENPVCRDRRRA